MLKVSYYNTVYFLRYFLLNIRNVCLRTYKNNRISAKVAYFLRKTQTSRICNLTILNIKNPRFSGNRFYMNLNIKIFKKLFLNDSGHLMKFQCTFESESNIDTELGFFRNFQRHKILQMIIFEIFTFQNNWPWLPVDTRHRFNVYTTSATS